MGYSLNVIRYTFYVISYTLYDNLLVTGSHEVIRYWYRLPSPPNPSDETEWEPPPHLLLVLVLAVDCCLPRPLTPEGGTTTAHLEMVTGTGTGYYLWSVDC